MTDIKDINTNIHIENLKSDINKGFETQGKILDKHDTRITIMERETIENTSNVKNLSATVNKLEKTVDKFIDTVNDNATTMNNNMTEFSKNVYEVVKVMSENKTAQQSSDNKKKIKIWGYIVGIIGTLTGFILAFGEKAFEFIKNLIGKN